MSISTEQVKAAFPTIGAPFKIGGGWAYTEVAYGIANGDTVNASVVGAATELADSIDNDGYFADLDYSEVIRGHVYCHAGVYYAVANSSETDCVWIRPTTAEYEEDAAIAADNLAETVAENERAYRESWCDGNNARYHFDSARQEIDKARICKSKGVPRPVWRDFVGAAKSHQRTALNLVRQSLGWTDEYREIFTKAKAENI